MKITPGLRRRHYATRISVFLVTVVLIAGMAGCEPTPTLQYDLTIEGTVGGSVTNPGEGPFTYNEGAVVNLTAEAEEGYHFDGWLGNVDTIADVDDATTTITMNGDYFIVAEFAVNPQNILITTSTEGGEVTYPGEGIFAYYEGEVVNLVATPDAGYRFVNWTGNVGTIADVDDATTTITMSGNYSITANFIPQMVAAGGAHTVGLKSNGTVVDVGWNPDGQCNVAGWGLK